MPRYFFDTNDGSHETTGEEFEFDGPDQARDAVLQSLPCMAKDALPGFDKRVLTTTARDEAGGLVYTATLTLDGHWG